MLKRLHLENVGPASQLDVEFGDRLNVFTGDNGLGKTFLLDLAWWLLTEEGGISPTPQLNWSSIPRIEYEANIELREQLQVSLPEKYQLKFEPRYQKWQGDLFNTGNRLFLGVYARIDGSFSVFDALRTIVSVL